MSKNQVYVCSSYFHVYISILQTLENKNPGSKSLIIINDHLPELKTLIPALVSNNFFDFHLAVPLTSLYRKKTSKISRFLNRNTQLIKRVDSSTDILTYENFIKDSEINIFNNRGGAYTYFLLKFKDSYIRLLEDGLGNYQPLIGKFKAFRRKYLLNTVIGAGHDIPVKEILVQFPEKVIEPLKKKAKKLELQKMQAALSADNRERILKIFLRDYTPSLSDGKKLILVTQPLSEERYFSEDTKIKLYNDLLAKYAESYSVFIKPHPRELTNYKGKITGDFTEIPRDFPLEMMNLLEDMYFDLGITLYSGALNNMNGIKEKVFLGKELLQKYK